MKMAETFEIRKAGFTNKGAAMMLIAAAREIHSRVPGSRVVVAANYTTPFEDRARHGLWHRAELIRGGVDLLGFAVERLPAKLRKRYGFVTDAEVDVVFDAAGFAYSDQWGVAPLRDLANRAARWKRAGKKLIMLPQAFGPFEEKGAVEALRRVADSADLIYAREQVSYDYLTKAVGERENIHLAPDFTNLLSPIANDRFICGSGAVAIVPNSRMLDKALEAERTSYIEFLRLAIELTREAGLKPFILIHETAEDGRLARQLNQLVRVPLEMIDAQDPLVAKGIIAQCDLVIGSRYHALVSALSQAVPVLGTGWSHKYRELFADYGYLEGLTSVDLDHSGVYHALKPLLSMEGRASVAARLTSAGLRLKADVSRMWDTIFREIGGACLPGSSVKGVNRDE